MSYIWGFLKKFGMKLFGILKSYLMISAAVVIILSVLIWRYGPRINIADYKPFEPETHRLIAIMVVLFLWGVNNLFVQFKRAKPKPKKEPKVEKDPIKIRVAAFEKSFHEAMKTIKTNWMGEKAMGNSFYALPWYLVLGFPNAGKTSLIADSDLKFPLAHFFGQENSKKIDPTHDVDYWVTNDAILFDVSGEMVEHVTPEDEEDEDEETIVVKAKKDNEPTAIWKAFQKLLVQYRPRRPINGVVLCIDLADLLRWDEEERLRRAKILHSRLVELSDTLGTRYTIHIVLTKVDLLEGFHDFFGALPQSKRAEPFGFTFELYSQQEGDIWLERFQETYNKYISRVNDQLLDRLAKARKTSDRQKIYLFSRHLAGLSEVLNNYLSHALHQDHFSTAPLVRGVFWSSTRQEGVPFNPVLDTVASHYRMERAILPAHTGYSKPYFANDLLKSVVFKESGLAGDNIRVVKSKKLAMRGSILASALGLLGFGFFYYTASNDNIAKANQAFENALAFKNTDAIDRNEIAGAEHLPTLDAVDKAREVFVNYDEKLASAPILTLYQGKNVGPEIDKAYVEVLSDDFLVSISEVIEEKISDLGENEATMDSDERLDALRAYIMLADKSKREPLEELEGKPSSVEKWLYDVWQTKYEGDLPKQERLQRHLRYALYDADLEVEANEFVVNSAQKDLRRIPRDIRLYNSIKSLSKRQLAEDVSFRNDIGPSYNIVFEQIELPQDFTNREREIQNLDDVVERQEIKTASLDLSIAPFFTKPFFHDFFIPQKDELSTVTLEDAWVAGEREAIKYSPEDLEFFKRRVSQRYASEYQAVWSDALAQLEITDFRDLDHGVRVLEEITGPNNPLGRLIELVKTNTELYESKKVAVTDGTATDLQFNADRENGLRITRAFSRLNQVITPKAEGEKPYLEDLMVHLNALYEYMKEMRQAGNRRGELALVKAKNRINLSGDDPIFIVRRLAADLPSPLNRFLEKIADESWKIVLLESKLELQSQWRSKVYDQFQTNLANRYPFNTKSKEDVALKDFESFFGPNGVIETFFKDNLTPFINSDTGQPKVLDGQEIALNPGFVEQLQKTLAIRKYYFDNKGLLSLSFFIQPKRMSSKVRRSVLNFEGQIIPYSHGPRRPTTIIWPNSLTASSPSKLAGFAGSRQPFGVTYQGPWSGFRLLDRGTLSNIEDDRTDITFSLGSSGKVTYTIQVTERENFFVTKPLANIKIPSEL